MIPLPQLHRILLAFLFLACSILYCSADTASCIAACDNTTMTGVAITICGTDLQTHHTFQGAYSGSSSCYIKCGVGLYHVGPCGCPNNCYSNISRGVCNESSVCSCSAGWGGQDCSVVKCPSSCSGHGVCGTVEGKDACICSAGWTASDCSIAVDNSLANTVPYGQLVPGQYYDNDKYDDDHPVFRPELMATVRVYINQSDLLYCLTPANAYNQTWVYGDLIFNNGLSSKTITNIGIRIKGAVSRTTPKKSWSVKINTEKGRDWKNMKGFGLKTADGSKVVSNQLTVELYRSMMVQTYRTGFAEFWINDIFIGLYTIQEKFDDNFLKSRFDSEDSYLYKIGHYDMSYYGTNVSSYTNLTFAFDAENPTDCIEQSEGDGNWTTFIDLAASLSTNTLSTSTFDIDTFVRAMVLEAYTQNMDGYNGLSNNYFMMNTKNKKVMWQYAAQDFDFALGSGIGGGGGGGNGAAAIGGGAANGGGGAANGGAAAANGGGGTGTANNTATGAANGGAAIMGGGNGGGGGNNGGGGRGGMGSLSANIFSFNSLTRPINRNVFAVSSYNQTYAVYVSILMAGLNPNITTARAIAYANLMAPVVTRDMYFQAVSGQTQASFLTAMETVKNWIGQRYLNVSQQLEAVLPQLTTSTTTATLSSSSTSNPATVSPTLSPTTPTPSPSPSPSSTSSGKSSSHTVTIVFGVFAGVILAVGMAVVGWKVYSQRGGVSAIFNKHKLLSTRDDDEEASL